MGTLFSSCQPCLSEIVLFELDGNPTYLKMHPARKLSFFNGFERVSIPDLLKRFNEFKAKQSNDIRQFLEKNCDDGLIGYSAVVMNIPVIITKNTRDFDIWKHYGIKIIREHGM